MAAVSPAFLLKPQNSVSPFLCLKAPEPQSCHWSPGYDPKNDSWSIVAPLNVPQDAVVVCALGDKLFAVGGYNRHTKLSHTMHSKIKENRKSLFTLEKLVHVLQCEASTKLSLSKGRKMDTFKKYSRKKKKKHVLSSS